MIVTLYLGNTPIESRTIPDKNLEIKGYFEGLQRDMLEENEDIMFLSRETPSFGIERLPSKPIQN